MARPRLGHRKRASALAAMVAASDGDWLAPHAKRFFAAAQRDTDLLAIVRGISVRRSGRFINLSCLPISAGRRSPAIPGDGQESREVVNLDKVLDKRTRSPRGNQVGSERQQIGFRQRRGCAPHQGRGKGIGRIEWRCQRRHDGCDERAVRALHMSMRSNKRSARCSGENVIESSPIRGAIFWRRCPHGRR